MDEPSVRRAPPTVSSWASRRARSESRAGSRFSPTPIRPTNILEYGRWQLGRAGQWREVEVEDGRMTGKGVLAKLAGVETPEDARLETGAEIAVGAAKLPPPAPGEYYWSDLEGPARRSAATAVPLGRIDDFRATPGGTVVVIRGEREHWVPFVKERIVKVDLDAGRIVLDWAADW